MGGWITLILGCFTSYIFFKETNYIFLVLSAVTTIVSFWSFGVMHNYAMDSAVYRIDRLKENFKHEGRPQEEIDRLDRIIINPTEKDLNNIPDVLTYINMGSSIMVIVFFIIMIIKSIVIT